MLYEQVRNNKRRTVMLVLLFILLVFATGWAVGYLVNGDMYSGAIITAIILIIYIPVSYFTASQQVLAIAGARQVSRDQYPQLYNIVEELIIPARLPMPKIYVVHDDAPNAFATGINPEKASVAVTTGLLGIVNREELEGVIAHELAHIKNFDIRLMTVSISLVSVIVLLVELGSRIMFFNGSRRNDNDNRHPVLIVIAVLFLVLSPLLSQFMKLAVSRNREFLADATAVEFTRNPQGLINALRKISGENLNVKEATDATAGMYFANPFGRKKKRFSFSSMLSTHPPIERRIESLYNMYK